MDTKIQSVKFQDSNHRYGDREVIATLTGGHEVFVFAWFSDELSFQESDFVGKTVEQARDVKTVRDIAYLRSP